MRYRNSHINIMKAPTPPCILLSGMSRCSTGIHQAHIPFRVKTNAPNWTRKGWWHHAWKLLLQLKHILWISLLSWLRRNCGNSKIKHCLRREFSLKVYLSRVEGSLVLLGTGINQAYLISNDFLLYRSLSAYLSLSGQICWYFWTTISF